MEAAERKEIAKLIAEGADGGVIVDPSGLNTSWELDVDQWNTLENQEVNQATKIIDVESEAV